MGEEVAARYRYCYATDMDEAQWVITTYDQNLHAGAQAVFSGSHSQAVIEAERMINHQPQWSYQIEGIEAAA